MQIVQLKWHTFFAGTESSEVFRGLRYDVVSQFHSDTAQILTIGGNIEEYFSERHVINSSRSTSKLSWWPRGSNKWRGRSGVWERDLDQWEMPDVGSECEETALRQVNGRGGSSGGGNREQPELLFSFLSTLLPSVIIEAFRAKSVSIQSDWSVIDWWVVTCHFTSSTVHSGQRETINGVRGTCRKKRRTNATSCYLFIDIRRRASRWQFNFFINLWHRES